MASCWPQTLACCSNWTFDCWTFNRLHVADIYKSVYCLLLELRCIARHAGHTRLLLLLVGPEVSCCCAKTAGPSDLIQPVAGTFEIQISSNVDTRHAEADPTSHTGHKDHNSARAHVHGCQHQHSAGSMGLLYNYPNALTPACNLEKDEACAQVLQEEGKP